MQVLSILVAVILNLIFVSLYHRFSKKRRIYCNDEGWFPISLLNEKLQVETFLLTDGELVDSAYLFTYDSKGRVVFGYPKRPATHWRQLPKPPMS